MRNTRCEAFEKLVASVNRKSWWHVPPVDPDAYLKRGKFLASSFEAAEFYGRPLDEPTINLRGTRGVFSGHYGAKANISGH